MQYIFSQKLKLIDYTIINIADAPTNYQYNWTY